MTRETRAEVLRLDLSHSGQNHYLYMTVRALAPSNRAKSFRVYIQYDHSYPRQSTCKCEVMTDSGSWSKMESMPGKMTSDWIRAQYPNLSEGRVRATWDRLSKTHGHGAKTLARMEEAMILLSGHLLRMSFQTAAAMPHLRGLQLLEGWHAREEWNEGRAA